MINELPRTANFGWTREIDNCCALEYEMDNSSNCWCRIQCSHTPSEAEDIPNDAEDTPSEAEDIPTDAEDKANARR